MKSLFGRDNIRCVLALLALGVSAGSLGCASDEATNEAKPLRIFAAASLTSLLPELAESFQEAHGSAAFEYSFAATSVLAKQIEHGADADIFLSANTLWVDYLCERDLLKPSTRTDFLSNRLVVVEPTERNDIRELEDLLSPRVQTIAVADWTHVPAGIYAKEALTKANLWQALQAKCLPALDVRVALTYVEREDADCGIVYRSDAAISRKIRVAVTFPDELQENIRYSAAQTSRSEHPEASSFLTFLLSERAREIIRKHHFVPIRS